MTTTVKAKVKSEAASQVESVAVDNESDSTISELDVALFAAITAAAERRKAWLDLPGDAPPGAFYWNDLRNILNLATDAYRSLPSRGRFYRVINEIGRFLAHIVINEQELPQLYPSHGLAHTLSMLDKIAQDFDPKAKDFPESAAGEYPRRDRTILRAANDAIRAGWRGDDSLARAFLMDPAMKLGS